MAAKTQLTLDFASMVLDAELFDLTIAKKLAEQLPCTISLTRWGNKLLHSLIIDTDVQHL